MKLTKLESLAESKGESAVAFSEYIAELTEYAESIEAKKSLLEHIELIKAGGMKLLKAGYMFSDNEFKSDVFWVHFPRSSFLSSDFVKGPAFYYLDHAKPTRFDNRPFFITSYEALAQKVQVYKLHELYEQRMQIEADLKAMS